MRITICSSVDFTTKIKEVKDTLEKYGHTLDIPHYSELIIAGKVTMADYLKEKNSKGDFDLRQRSGIDLIKRHYEHIQKTDAILVINIEKKGIKNYIGGNTFLEVGFAYVLGKKIFFLNDIPDMPYTDELRAMHPVVLQGKLDVFKKND